MTEFDRITDLKQIKSDEELVTKMNEIIDSLSDFTKHEKYRILTTLSETFFECLEDEGIAFLELKSGDKNRTS